MGALMFTVNRTNPVNGILPLTGLIRSTAFPCPPEYRAGQRTSFPFPNTTSKLVGLFSPLCPTPPSFLYIHKKSAWCRTCGGVCCVCCVPPQGPRAPLAPCLGTEALQRQYPPWVLLALPVKAREEREGTRLPLPQRSVKRLLKTCFS